jgi:hypothetical protein
MVGYEFTIAGKRYRSSTRTTDKALGQKVESRAPRFFDTNRHRVSATLHEIKAAESAKRAGEIREGVETYASQAKRGAARSRAVPTTRRGSPATITAKTLLREAAEAFLEVQRERHRKATVESNQGHVQSC